MFWLLSGRVKLLQRHRNTNTRLKTDNLMRFTVSFSDDTKHVVHRQLRFGWLSLKSELGGGAGGLTLRE